MGYMARIVFKEIYIVQADAVFISLKHENLHNIFGWAAVILLLVINININVKILFPWISISLYYIHTLFWLLLFCIGYTSTTHISDAVCMPIPPKMVTVMPTHHDKREHKGYRNSLRQLYNHMSENNCNYIFKYYFPSTFPLNNQV